MQAPDVPARQWPRPVIAVAAPATVLLPFLISYNFYISSALQRLIPREQPASTHIVLAGLIIAWLLSLCICVTAAWIFLKNDPERTRWKRYRRNLFIILL